MTNCDEDRKELRCKTLLMTEALIAFKTLREGMIIIILSLFHNEYIVLLS